MDSLRKACMLSPVPALLSSDEGLVETANARACAALGCTWEQVLGKKLEALIAPDSVAEFREAISSSVNSGTQAELELRRADGSSFRAELTSVRIPLDDGALVWTTFRDVSEREALAQSEAAFRALAQATDEAVVLHRQGTVVLTNDAATRMFGANPEGMALLDFVAPEERAKVLARTAAGSLEAYESVGLRADGTCFPVEARGAKVSYMGETLRVVTLRDLSERRRMERKLTTSDRLASIGLLAGGVAHEINNPLAYVVLNLDLVKETLSGVTAQNALAAAEEVLPSLNQALEGADRIRVIVDDLRTLAKEPDAEEAVTELERAVEIAASVTRNTIRHAATLHIDVPRGLWVSAKEGRLAQVFVNLLNNAAQSIEPGAAGENTIHVAASLDPEDHHVVRIEVRDTGSGMAPDLIQRVFDPFVSSGGGAGMGLGLSIVHGIVTDAGGSIDVASELGKGTSFTIRLAKAAAPNEEASTPREATELEATRARILVVDDEPPVRNIVARILRRAYEVETADSGVSALKLLEESGPFDAVLCDVMMPNIGGAELLGLVSKRWPELAERFVFMSGGAISEDPLFAEGSGPVLLSKPFKTDELLATIAAALSAQT